MRATPMKENELRGHATCSLCNRRIGACGVPIFYRVRIDGFGLDLNELQRQQGLTMQLGGAAALAAVMGPDKDMAQPLGDTAELTVCQDCALSATYPVAGLSEIADEEQMEPDERYERDDD